LDGGAIAYVCAEEREARGLLLGGCAAFCVWDAVEFFQEGVGAGGVVGIINGLIGF